MASHTANGDDAGDSRRRRGRVAAAYRHRRRRARHHRADATRRPICANGATVCRAEPLWSLRPGSDRARWPRVLAVANEAGIGIVPQGGNTGLVGGQIPSASGNEVVLSLSRLNRVREVDAGTAMIVEAGVTLLDAQTRRRSCRAPVSVEPALGRQLRDRRRAGDECRRRRRPGLWQRARACARARGGARGRTDLGRPAHAQERQHRLRPARSLHRIGGHARRHHRGCAEAVPAAAPRRRPRSWRCPISPTLPGAVPDGRERARRLGPHGVRVHEPALDRARDEHIPRRACLCRSRRPGTC